MDREDGERLARIEVHLEAVRDGIKEIRELIRQHADGDNKEFDSLNKRISSHSSQIASLKTKQRIVWGALGSILSALGLTQLGSLFK